jgi:serine O-acetyltransferase
LKCVPPDCTVVGIPGRIVHRHGVKVSALDHFQVPDPEGDVIRSLIGRVEQLERNAEAHTLHPINNYIIDSELLKNVRPRHLTPCDRADHFDHPPEYEGFSEGGGI